jgi:outer membrane immunogenic protein
MKRLVFGASMAIAFAGAAGATDLPVRAPVYKAPAVVEAFSWTGCFVGGHVGAIQNDSTLTAHAEDGASPAVVAATTHKYHANNTSFTGGVQYGCNKQFGQLLLGLDSSFSWAGINQTFTAFHPTVPGVVAGYTETFSQQLDWYSTTRARLGWAHDRWMVFVAGGLATGTVESKYSAAFFGSTFAGSEDKFRFGWTIGGGLEFALSQNWFVRGEYLYVDLGDFSYKNFSAASPGSSFRADVDTKFHVARVALSYRFTRAPSLLQWALGGFKY